MSAWPSSLRSRLTLWYSVLLALPLLAFAVICYAVFASALRNRTDRFIADALTAFSRELVAERRLAISVDQAVRTTVEEVRFRDLHIAVFDSARAVIASTSQASEPDAASPRFDALIANAIRAPLDTVAFTTTISYSGAAYRLVARPLVVNGTRLNLTGMYSLDDSREMLARIREIFALAIPLLILGAATGGSVLAKRSLAPMSAMTARAAAISATNLSERVPVAGSDELTALARVVNGLLDRLQDSFEHQRHFMTDASHELRTPAAILRTETDVTLAQEHRTEAEYRESVNVMRDAARRISRIVDDLFLLARADAGQLTPRNAPLYLEEILHDAVRGVTQLGEQRGVRVALGDVVEAPFRGDADLLGQLVLNLLDNAIKHAPTETTVDIGMTQRSGAYEISVVNAGAGIPPEAHAHVFDRFFRVDAADESTEAGAQYGAGLGLAIARRIAELHGGQLNLIESRPGRTEFRLTLPAQV